MSYYISCIDLESTKDKPLQRIIDGQCLKHFEVPKSVYVYIQQLETQIKYPCSKTGVVESYKFRFDHRYNHLEKETGQENE